MIMVTVQRLDGTVEEVRAKVNLGANPALWDKMIMATRAAGRGECLSWREVPYEQDAPSSTIKCDRCRVEMPRAGATSRQEWDRLGSERIRVTAHYCPHCAALLRIMNVVPAPGTNGAVVKTAFSYDSLAQMLHHVGRETMTAGLFGLKTDSNGDTTGAPSLFEAGSSYRCVLAPVVREG